LAIENLLLIHRRRFQKTDWGSKFPRSNPYNPNNPLTANFPVRTDLGKEAADCNFPAVNQSLASPTNQTRGPHNTPPQIWYWEDYNTPGSPLSQTKFLSHR
jgi:hypothetical protein